MFKTFFLFYRFRNTYESNESHSLENARVKILVLESESTSESESCKKFLDPNPKKNLSGPQHCFILRYRYFV
jgi:arginine/ornithine N-succinyltransferase beta subunit